MSKRAVAESGFSLKNLTERTSVFTITEPDFSGTIEAIYHNVENLSLKLASFGLVPSKIKLTPFYKTNHIQKPCSFNQVIVTPFL